MSDLPARSIAFDPAADYYDQTRELGAGARRAVTDLLLAEVRGRGRCLEIGVGTGLVALPLFRAGVPMAGVDLSAAMLRKLVEKAGGVPFPLATADATVLPFRDGAFGAAVVSHVLHLIDPWQRAVDELGRVVRPGGVLLVALGGRGRDDRHGDAVGEVRRRFWSFGPEAWRPPGPDHRMVDEEMRRRGFDVRSLPPVVDVREGTLDEVISRLEAGFNSRCWKVTDEARHEAAARTREWARSRFGRLDVPQRLERRIAWRAYDVPRG